MSDRVAAARLPSLKKISALRKSAPVDATVSDSDRGSAHSNHPIQTEPLPPIEQAILFPQIEPKPRQDFIMSDTSDELIKLTATEVVARLRSKEVSPLDLVEASIQRIEAVDTEINALPIHCFDQARAQAKSMDIDAHAENPKSLCGLPIAVKDYNDLAGAVTTYGSPIFADNVAKHSDATVRQLESNGAIAVAKSNVPEWAGGHTFNPVNGLTRNPWDLRKSAGGSSGGSAAALASGSVWLATGNDLGGNQRDLTELSACAPVRAASPGAPACRRWTRFGSKARWRATSMTWP